MNVSVKHLKKFKKLLVTGPQRSGTTIAANVLARELGYKYVDESHVKTRSLTSLFKMLTNRESMVVQGPCFSSIAHWVDTPETAVVMMIRGVDEIRSSEARIDWKWEKGELRNYFLEDGVISVAKYDAWERFQKPNMLVPYFELHYCSLSNHPMWIDKEGRKGFRRDIAPPKQQKGNK